MGLDLVESPKPALSHCAHSTDCYNKCGMDHLEAHETSLSTLTWAFNESDSIAGKHRGATNSRHNSQGPFSVAWDALS